MPNPLPYVTAAFLCERILQEKDDVISALRIIDRLQYRLEGAPQDTKPMLNLQALIMFKSGPVTGEHDVKIIVENPRGDRKEVYALKVVLNGKDHGQNIIMNMGLGVEHDGLYWFDVVFDADVLTRIPLTVTALPQQEQIEKQA